MKLWWYKIIWKSINLGLKCTYFSAILIKPPHNGILRLISNILLFLNKEESHNRLDKKNVMFVINHVISLNWQFKFKTMLSITWNGQSFICNEKQLGQNILKNTNKTILFNIIFQQSMKQKRKIKYEKKSSKGGSIYHNAKDMRSLTRLCM